MESLAAELRSDAFSLTLDESTSESGQRVLCILVQHFVNNTLVVDNLRCCSLPRMDAASIVCATKSTLDELQIPLQKVVSIFSDGCNVMRGKNNGVFVQLKKEMPRLVDVGNDTCHIVNIAAAKLTMPVETVGV